jgi:hypothetical protein
MVEAVSIELDPFDLTTLKIVLCGNETIKQIVKKYPRHCEKRTTLHDSLKRLIAADLILEPIQREEGDSREMIYQPKIEELCFWTYCFQLSFGLGSKEILSVLAPDKLASFIKTVKKLALHNPPRINEINTHSRMLLKEYTDLPKEELKKVIQHRRIVSSRHFSIQQRKRFVERQH